MTFTPTPLTGSYVVQLQPMRDDRGWFVRSYCRHEFSEIGHTAEWVQMNHSCTSAKGSLRGMHYQVPPYREIKLVRCVRGNVFDVIVDIREQSPTFLQWFGVELSASKMNMLYIPEGFAHGFQCMTDDCELIYHHSEFYVPGAEGGIRYDDPRVGIRWPMPVTVISERDRSHPELTGNFKGI